MVMKIAFVSMAKKWCRWLAGEKVSACTICVAAGYHSQWKQSLIEKILPASIEGYCNIEFLATRGAGEAHEACFIPDFQC